MKPISDLLRPNILNLKPYSSARDEFSGSASVFLDANENPYKTGYNRYPDPYQQEVKKRIAEIKSVEFKRLEQWLMERTVFRKSIKYLVRVINT